MKTSTFVAAAMIVAAAVHGAQAVESQRDHVVGAAAAAQSPDAVRRAYDNAGTVGRVGLGADPRRPEGSGTMSN
jgi:hypothetical protein